MRVALVGPPLSGKTNLFAAVALAGGSKVDVSRGDQPHLAVVKVPDERLEPLAKLYNPKKLTPAELEFLDLPGMDLSEEATRARARAHWPAMRNSDGLVFVVRSFKSDLVPQYRDRINPASDLEELKGEMLFADLDQVMARIEKLNASIKKPTAKKEEYAKELELMQRLQGVLESDKPISGAIATQAEAKLTRSFSFLSEKPAVAVVNCDEDSLAGETAGTLAGFESITLSAKIEEELAQLAPAERQEFLAGYGLTSTARDRLIRACYKKLNLVSFLTVGEDEVRAWTIPAGADAVTAASAIHSDIARGFIRAETVAYEDLRAAGDMKGVKAAGKVRLEGKTYIVKDGDIINFRFNV
jgi:GTP-binding protein YchF